MRLSNTITTITGGGSDGWDLFIKARKMISEGHNITELTIGEHDIKTDTRILEAMHAAALGGATRGPNQPMTPYRRQRQLTTTKPQHHEPIRWNGHCPLLRGRGMWRTRRK